MAEKMDLKEILLEHEKNKKKIKELFQSKDQVKSFLDFDEMEIVFVIRAPIKKKVLDIAKDMLEINENNDIILRSKGLSATQKIKEKINQFVTELEKNFLDG